MRRFWVALALVVALTALVGTAASGSVVSQGDTMVSPVVASNTVLLGDANGDAVVDMGDVVKQERCIIGWDTDCSPGADADADGDVDMGDVLTTEFLILGQP